MNGAGEQSAGAGPPLVPPELVDHPDRLRWNQRYTEAEPDFAPHPLVAEALDVGIPAGPVLELACGRSGSALALAAKGREITAVDVADHALAQLWRQARRRELDGRIRCVLADVSCYTPPRHHYALVLATRYWDRAAFDAGCVAVAPGGLLAWEALACAAGEERRPYRVEHGELGRRLPAGFMVLDQRAHGSGRQRASLLLARRS
ncbi:methyltransferase domain-containing protein [Haloechinothrix sp. LS1_15]|uniref:methyltransferase domain-containing protein n=1 Tax=Haloechinothrix sp. LS1_15 TaxID=2652248 RepID=UPI00294B5602|nr:methyltransferase domain-containing protein [Haloechinothrix sp. LS1_15]